MNPERFDRLAKAVAVRTTRRNMLRGMLGVAAPIFAGALIRRRDAVLATPIVPVGGTAHTDPGNGSTELDYFALGDSIAAGHGLLDHDGPDPAVVGKDFLLPTCRDCDSDACNRCESAGCDDCLQETGICTHAACTSDLACRPCCRRSKNAYPRFVRDALKTPDSAVHLHHLACTGATSLSPITLDGINLEITSPIPPEQMLVTQHRNPSRLLRQQVDAALAMLAGRSTPRPALVSVTIGANDLEFARVEGPLLNLLSPAGKHLVVMSPETYGTWVTNRTKAVQQEVSFQLRRLLQEDGVVVVVTEAHNPFSMRSALFPPQVICHECGQRVAQAAKALNGALRGAVSELQGDYPGRIDIAAIHDSFEQHKAAGPKCGADGPVVGTPAQDGAWRAKGTWIQYPDDVTSNSYSLTGKNWSGDCVHPNKDGARFIADAVARVALPMLGKLAGVTITKGPVASDPTASTVSITWTTDKAADSTVEYGETTDYGQSAADSTSTTDHRIMLSGLTPGTTYHYRVRSANASGTVVTKRDRTFTTAAVTAKQIAVQIVVYLCALSSPVSFTSYPLDSKVGGDGCTTGTVPLTITDATGVSSPFQPDEGSMGNILNLALAVGSYTLVEQLTGASYPFDLSPEGLRIIIRLPACAGCTLGRDCPVGSLCVRDDTCCEGERCVDSACTMQGAGPVNEDGSP